MARKLDRTQASPRRKVGLRDAEALPGTGLGRRHSLHPRPTGHAGRQTPVLESAPHSDRVNTELIQLLKWDIVMPRFIVSVFVAGAPGLKSSDLNLILEGRSRNKFRLLRP